MSNVCMYTLIFFFNIDQGVLSITCRLLKSDMIAHQAEALASWGYLTEQARSQKSAHNRSLLPDSGSLSDTRLVCAGFAARLSPRAPCAGNISYPRTDYAGKHVAHHSRRLLPSSLHSADIDQGPSACCGATDCG